MYYFEVSVYATYVTCECMHEGARTGNVRCYVRLGFNAVQTCSQICFAETWSPPSALKTETACFSDTLVSTYESA